MAQCARPELRVIDVALPLLGGSLVFAIGVILFAKYYIGFEDETVIKRPAVKKPAVGKADDKPTVIAPDKENGFIYLLYPSILALLASIWYQQVNNAVHEPYLDEFFHVRQAQVYCHTSNFTNWDPKITTPPGLYLLSYVLNLAGQGCDIATLRLTNASAIVFTWIPVFLLLRQQQARGQTGSAAGKGHAAHTALNIALFPPLFFFSVLYYTDIVSTEVVLWSLYLRGNETLQRIPFVRGIVLVLVGTVALWFRQTNVFWVGVFNAALDAVKAVKDGIQAQRAVQGKKHSVQQPATLWEAVQRSWEGNFLYNIPAQEACFEDYLISLVSLAITAVAQLSNVVLAVLPQLSILLIFAGFVIWNGGVVLGDKSNHIATLHTPQMLYIWPYMFFFSSPVVFPVIFNRLALSSTHTKASSTSSSIALPTSSSQAAYLATRVLLFLGLTAAALASIHYNTIVHPFTLADNRHYVFYVFRILRRHWALKYLAAPIYVICAWLAVSALGGQRVDNDAGNSLRSLKADIAKKDGKSNLNDGGADRSSYAPATPSTSSTSSTAATATTTSIVLIWLITTTLTLITAPLVEPRYFILPWLVWRLHILPSSFSSSLSSSAAPTIMNPRLVLWAETAWFVAINVATGYMFLHRGFEWPQEPGNVQRFLW